MLNLEPLAAQSAARMVSGNPPKEAENLITKAAAVLAEQGVYAFGLFLASRKRDAEQRPAADIDAAIRQLLQQAGLVDELHRISMGEYYGGIGKQRSNETPTHALRRLLLTKQLMEVALNYGRYHAKAQGGGA